MFTHDINGQWRTQQFNHVHFRKSLSNITIFFLQFYKVNYIFCDGQSRFIKIYFGQHSYTLIQLSIRLFLIVPISTKLIYYLWHIKLIIYNINCYYLVSEAWVVKNNHNEIYVSRIQFIIMNLFYLQIFKLQTASQFLFVLFWKQTMCNTFFYKDKMLSWR